METIKEREKWRYIITSHFEGELDNKAFNKISLENYLNPTYREYELIVSLTQLNKHNEFSPYYNNLLMLNACVHQCANDKDLKIWKEKFKNSKFMKNLEN
jgi:hypothetical protein